MAGWRERGNDAGQGLAAQSWVALTAVATLVAACGGGKGSTGGTVGGTVQIGGETANDHGSADLSGKASFQLELGDLGPAQSPFFAPTVLTGTPGQTVKLTLENDGVTPHNFTIVDQGVDQDVAAGQEGSVTVTFPQSGFLEFHCKFHSAQGMVGELKVA